LMCLWNCQLAVNKAKQRTPQTVMLFVPKNLPVHYARCWQR
jgi:hypothetical protein